MHLVEHMYASGKSYTGCMFLDPVGTSAEYYVSKLVPPSGNKQGNCLNVAY